MQDINRSRSLWAAISTSVILAMGGAALPSAATASATTTGQRFGDPAGDANGGPDVSSVAIHDRGGVVTFTIMASGVKVTAGSGVKGTLVYAGLDTNGDGKSDYYLDVYGDATGVGWDIEDSREKTIPQTPTMGFFASGDSYTFTLSSTDLGGATGFSFYVKSVQKADGADGVNADAAPDGGRWSYSLTSVKPVIGTPTMSPATPLAGHPLIITFPVTRSDNGARFSGGTLKTDLALGGVALTPAGHLANGTASLHLRVPASARGKLLTLRVGVTFAGQSATRSTTFHVG
jgi:hypothetical protein